MAQSAIKVEVLQEARICLLAGAAINNSADPSDALVVLLSGPLSSMHGQIYNSAELAKRIKEQFGWSMSTDALDFLVNKFRRHGWLRSQPNAGGKLGLYHVHLVEPEAEPEPGVSTADALSQLGRSFRDFADNISPIHVLPKDDQEAGATLLRFVVDAATPIDLKMGRARTEEEYLAARYSEEVTRAGSPAAALLQSLTAVGFLFRVAEELASPSRRRRTDLKVVLDGPIILDLLGCSGQPRAEAVSGMFTTLSKLGATLATFEHNVEEAKEVLSTIVKTPARDRYGPTGDALRKGLVHENFLRGLLQGFDLAVRNKGIQIITGDITAYPNSHHYFDRSRIDALEQVVNWHDEDNDIARYRDVDTTALIVRKRAYHRTTDIFDSKFVCITGNRAFAGQTKRHLIEANYYNSGQVPPVVTLKELAARAWIEVGVSDSERMSIPKSQLLLTCDRSLRLNRKVVEKAKLHLQQAKPDQLKQFELLLEVPRSARALMDQTLNDERYVSAENIELLVETVVEAAGREGAERERKKRLKETSLLKDKLAATQADLADEREASKLIQEQKDQQLAEARKRDEAILTSVVEMASRDFGSIRKRWRQAYLGVCLLPLVGFTFSLMAGQASMPFGIIAVLTVFFGLPIVMDRPGGWLTDMLKKRVLDKAIDRLHDLRRDDLASEAKFTWEKDDLVWSWAEPRVLPAESFSLAIQPQTMA